VDCESLLSIVQFHYNSTRHMHLVEEVQLVEADRALGEEVQLVEVDRALGEEVQLAEAE